MPKGKAVKKSVICFWTLFIWNNGDWLIKPEINRMVDVYEKPLADKIKEIFKYNRFDDICGVCSMHLSASY